MKKIKPGGYFLLYLYYKLENRPFYFKIFYWLSNLIRLVVSKLPPGLKRWSLQFSGCYYFICPLFYYAGFYCFLVCRKKSGNIFHLQAYERQSFYIIRNDSLDRFGTPLEQRFSRKQIQAMMEEAGLTDIIFSEKIPYWHAVGRKA